MGVHPQAHRASARIWGCTHAGRGGFKAPAMVHRAVHCARPPARCRGSQSPRWYAGACGALSLCAAAPPPPTVCAPPETTTKGRRWPLSPYLATPPPENGRFSPQLFADDFTTRPLRPLVKSRSAAGEFKSPRPPRRTVSAAESYPSASEPPPLKPPKP
eukprot:1182141-Prorocentrum_minimum.AAC.2